MNNNLIKISEAAKICGVNIVTMRVWADKGKVECIKDFAGHRYFNPEELRSIGNGIHPQGQPSLERFPDSQITLKELVLGDIRHGQYAKLSNFAKLLRIANAAGACSLTPSSNLHGLRRKLEVLGYDLVLIFVLVDGEDETTVLMDGKTHSVELEQFLSRLPSGVGFNAHEKLLSLRLRISTLIKYVAEIDSNSYFFLGVISKDDGKRWVLKMDDGEWVLS